MNANPQQSRPAAALDPERIAQMGDDHISTSVQTPLRPDAFALSDGDKVAIIAEHFQAIMHTLGLDLTDDSLAGTPLRVAKMYVQELFAGLAPANEPRIAVFDNHYGYGQMLLERDITVHSVCEHHFVPIIGKAHVAYIPAGKVIGLSKLNRIVDYYARRPQVQERMTVQIADHLQRVLGTPDVAVVIDAKHYCVAMRGVKDDSGSTVTAEYRGSFLQDAVRSEYLSHIHAKKG